MWIKWTFPRLRIDQILAGMEVSHAAVTDQSCIDDYRGGTWLIY